MSVTTIAKQKCFEERESEAAAAEAEAATTTQLLYYSFFYVRGGTIVLFQSPFLDPLRRLDGFATLDSPSTSTGGDAERLGRSLDFRCDFRLVTVHVKVGLKVAGDTATTGGVVLRQHGGEPVLASTGRL